ARCGGFGIVRSGVGTLAVVCLVLASIATLTASLAHGCLLSSGECWSILPEVSRQTETGGAGWAPVGALLAELRHGQWRHSRVVGHRVARRLRRTVAPAVR